MRIKHYQDTDTLYIELRSIEIAETRDLDENTLLDLDKTGKICGITIEHARLSVEGMFNGVPARQRAPSRQLRYIDRVTAHGKFLDRVLRGTSDKNIEFDLLCKLLRRFGFDQRIRGDHHIFSREDVSEILNLQPIGHLAKAYQVKQVRKIIVQYKMAGEADAK